MTAATETPHGAFERAIRERRYIRFTYLRSTDPVSKTMGGPLHPEEREGIPVMFGPWQGRGDQYHIVFRKRGTTELDEQTRPVAPDRLQGVMLLDEDFDPIHDIKVLPDGHTF